MLRGLFVASLVGFASIGTPGFAQNRSPDVQVWNQATRILCRSDDDGHLARNVDQVIRDIGRATVDLAADKRNSTALFLRSYGVFKGLGGYPRNPSLDRKDLPRAARDGHPLAGVHYASRYVSPSDRKQVFRWLKRAASADCPYAKLSYGASLVTMPRKRPPMKDWQEKLNDGFAILEESAASGYASAQFILSSFLRNGQVGGRVDKRRAIELLTAAADDGLPAAMSALAYSYLDGADVDQSSGKAIEIFLKMAKSGDPKRYAEVGELYLEGRVTPRNLAKAERYFDLAAKNGVTVKAEKLAELRALKSRASAKRRNTSVTTPSKARYLYLDCEGDQSTGEGFLREHTNPTSESRRYLIDLKEKSVSVLGRGDSAKKLCNDEQECQSDFGESVVTQRSSGNLIFRDFYFDKRNNFTREFFAFALTPKLNDLFTATCRVEHKSSAPISKTVVSDITPPALTNEVEFKARIRDRYPQRAFNLNRSGWVLLKATINAEGEIMDCIPSNTKYKPFGPLACRYLKRYARFKPALNRDGKAVVSTFQGRIYFNNPHVLWRPKKD